MQSSTYKWGSEYSLQTLNHGRVTNIKVIVTNIYMYLADRQLHKALKQKGEMTNMWVDNLKSVTLTFWWSF